MNSMQFQVPPEENDRRQSNATDRKVFSVFGLIIASLALFCMLALLTLLVLQLVPQQETHSHTLKPNQESTQAATDDLPTSLTPADVMLKETADAGLEYIGKMIFIGESTTAHLSSRPGLPIEASQVWKDSSGTKRLSSRITSEKIVCKGAELTVAEACAQEKPEYVVLSFGLNGITEFITNRESYVNNYSKLIRAIQTASPETRIILQTVYPISKADDFSVDVATLNAYIMTLNGWIPEIAAAHENVRVVDTASVLCNVDGVLGTAYDNGDGIHLNADAYLAVLDYLRTHAWQS